jgi:hypothetical protein
MRMLCGLQGKSSKEQGNLVVKEAVAAMMAGWGAPFRCACCHAPYHCEILTCLQKKKMACHGWAKEGIHFLHMKGMNSVVPSCCKSARTPYDCKLAHVQPVSIRTFALLCKMQLWQMFW